MSQERWKELADFLGRLGIGAYFTVAATLKIYHIYSLIVVSPEPLDSNKLLALIADGAVVIFLCTVVAITIFRLKPILAAESWEPRVSAMAGTFLLLFLALMPPASPPGMLLSLAGLVLVLLGSLMSAYVLTWLGRSFSIMAEARRLVTGGPYSIVRHPLYLVEEISTIGIILLNFSWQAVILGLVHWGLQLRRMHNEEQVLRAAFPEYESYTLRVPRIIPRLRSRKESVLA